LANERINTPDEDNVKVIVKQMSSQMLEQKKALAKVSKLCLGALNAIDQIETKMGEDHDEVAKQQPMERFKKMSGDIVQLSAVVHQLDLHLGDKLSRLGNNFSCRVNYFAFS